MLLGSCVKQREQSNLPDYKELNERAANGERGYFPRASQYLPQTIPIDNTQNRT